MLGLSRTTVDKLMNEGRLQRVKVGRRALITRKSIDLYVEGL
jgi:excisionase family DNA binding protein